MTDATEAERVAKPADVFTPVPDPTGGPAFPVSSPDMEPSGGMTLRDWFAGQALVALAGEEGVYSTLQRQADHAYILADAMLRARSAAP